MRRFFLTIAAAMTLAGSLALPAQANEPVSEARRFVESLSTSMIAVLRSDQIGAEERVGRLHALLNANVDLDLIGRYILADHWNDATPDQREEYQSLFARYALSLFSRTLVRQKLEQIAVVGLSDVARSHALVHTRIRKERGETVDWSWRVRHADNRFQAVDLIMNGVSLARSYRSEIGSVVANLGIDGLLALLRIKTTS